MQQIVKDQENLLIFFGLRFAKYHLKFFTYKMGGQQQTEDQNFYLHGVLFDGKIPQELREELNNNQIQSMLTNDKEWSIPYIDFVEEKWDKIFPFILEVSINKLVLMLGTTQMLIQISKTSFVAIKQIYLNHGLISSIEPLQFMNIPLLADLLQATIKSQTLKPLINVIGADESLKQFNKITLVLKGQHKERNYKRSKEYNVYEMDLSKTNCFNENEF